jgi:cAMP phosphodiesterase
MKLKVLGCFGGDLQGRFPGFLINETLLLDASTIGAVLSFKEQLKIKTILLTHHHIDHLIAIPFHADTVFSSIQNPVSILALQSVIENLKKHLLNDVL